MVPDAPILDAPPVERTLLSPEKRLCSSRLRFAARGDALRPPRKRTGPLDIWRSTPPTEPRGMVPDAAIPDAPSVLRTLLSPQKRRRYSRLRFAARSDAPPPPQAQSPPHDIWSFTTPTEPRGTVPDSPIPDAPPVLRTLLSPQKRARGGPLSVGQNPLSGPYIAQGTPNEKFLIDGDRQWQSAPTAFLRFGGGRDRQ
jgi:hypothetical protein